MTVDADLQEQVRKLQRSLAWVRVFALAGLMGTMLLVSVILLLVVANMTGDRGFGDDVYGISCVALLAHERDSMEEIRHLRANWDLCNLGTLVIQFWERRGRYPTDLQEMVLAKDSFGLPMDLTLLIQPVDPWGRPYEYEMVENCPVVRSLGADGRPGGSGGDRDLTWPSGADRQSGTPPSKKAARTFALWP